MKTINLTLYSFDDLSIEVQKQIIERERWNVMEQCMNSYSVDYRNSLEEFEKIFGIKCTNWEVGYCTYHFGFNLVKSEAFEWKYDYIPLETLSGKLLQRYIKNHILPYIEKGKYYSKLLGSYPNCKHVNRYSKIFKEIDCPLTGCCYDMYLLDPILKYIYSLNQTTDYETLIKQCLNSFFQSWHEEYEYWADNEDAIREELHNNQYENRLYYKSGAVYNGPLDDAA